MIPPSRWSKVSRCPRVLRSLLLLQTRVRQHIRYTFLRNRLRLARMLSPKACPALFPELGRQILAEEAPPLHIKKGGTNGKDSKDENQTLDEHSMYFLNFAPSALSTSKEKKG